MDEKISPPPCAAMRRSILPVFRLLATFGCVCWLFGLFGAPVFARTSPRTDVQSSSPAISSFPQVTIPVNWKAVDLAGVSLAVPASWPTYDLAAQTKRCVLFNAHAAYLGQQGPEAQCPARVFGKSEVLQLEVLNQASSSALRQATVTTTIAGVPAKINPRNDVGHLFVVVLTQAGVVIHLSYGKDPALARQILGTLRVSGKQAAAMTTRSQAVAHPAFASPPAGIIQGAGFDSCAAPSPGAMAAWKQFSPYLAAGIYIGGANRACGDGNLSASWVDSVSGSGWSLMPFYVGLQAPCNAQFYTIDPSQATSEGTQAADDAVNLAQGFDLGPGTQIINDMEGYDNANASCSQAVMTFLSAWTQELHARGYLSGVYSSLSSGITDLIDNAGSVQEPDTIDFAHWDGVASTSDPGVPSDDWDNNQRIKQYQGGHNETYDGFTINIDNDQLDTTLYNGSGGGRGSGVPAAPGASAAPTSIPTTRWWVDTFANAPGYRSGWTQVGTLYAGTNYVFCKEWGAEVSDNSGNFNHYWLWTDLDTGGSGWVSAYYLSKWGNDQALDNNGNVIPDCPT